MHNTKFIISCVVLAIGANIAIIGCNRQGAKTSKTDDSVSAAPSGQATVPAAHALPDMQQQNVAVPKNSPEEEMNHNASQQASAAQKNPYVKAEIEIKTFQVNPPATGYGYDILINGNTHGGIHQYNIPGVPGINGFSSEKNARKAAEFVVSKMRRNIMPPAVSAKELDSLGVLK